MTFQEIFSQNKKILSFEFFPPKKAENLESTKSLMSNLCAFKPDFMTVTYGAGGGTREFTKTLVSFISKELSVPSVSHLTCVGHTKEELRQIILDLYAEGIRHILALRGDAQANLDKELEIENAFSCARDLVRFLSQDDQFSIAVAGYPEVHQDAKSRDADLEYLKEKELAGASLIITQLFFDCSMYFEFCESARRIGIKSPIIPGLMPIGNVKQLEKFTNLCGASVPPRLLERLKAAEQDPEAVIEIGNEHAIKQVRELLAGGAPGIHFYTINKLNQIEVILKDVVGLFKQS